MSSVGSVLERMLNTHNHLKRQAAAAALKLIAEGSRIGVGTGSTVDLFIEELKHRSHLILGAVPSSIRTERLLKEAHIPIIHPNNADTVDCYIDGADEVMENGFMLKGQGAALTGEKIVAQIAQRFICITDYSKKVSFLGLKNVPVTLEVIPIARSYVAREVVRLGGTPRWRENEKTDYGNELIDVFGLKIDNPITWEERLSQIVGVVCCGIFSKNKADVVILSYPNQVTLIETQQKPSS